MNSENSKLIMEDGYLLEVYKKLVVFKQGGEKADFFELMKNIMPGVRKYIKNIFRKLEKNKQLPKGKYKVNDFVDELYIKAYDNIQEVKQDENFYGWLIKQADIVLEDTLVEEDFNHFFFKNIEDYTKAELDEMEENYYIDADGDYVMEEDSEDSTLPKNDYTLADVFVEETEQELIETISDKLKQAQIHKNIEMLSAKFSLLEYTVFDLNVNHKLTTGQIAEIKQIPIDKVEALLQKVKSGIKTIFHKRLFS